MSTENCSTCNLWKFCEEHDIWRRNQQKVFLNDDMSQIYFQGEKNPLHIVNSVQQRLNTENEWTIWIGKESYRLIVCKEKINSQMIHSVDIGFLVYYKGFIFKDKESN